VNPKGFSVGDSAGIARVQTASVESSYCERKNSARQRRRAFAGLLVGGASALALLLIPVALDSRQLKLQLLGTISQVQLLENNDRYIVVELDKGGSLSAVSASGSAGDRVSVAVYQRSFTGKLTYLLQDQQNK